MRRQKRIRYKDSIKSYPTGPRKEDFFFPLALIICFLGFVFANPPETLATELNQKWTGDFNSMVERQLIRALVPYNQTHFFLDRGHMRGATYETLLKFEKEINDKLDHKPMKISVLFIPVFRDEIVTALIEGRGDIAAAGLTITPERKKVVDFTDPVTTGVDEIVVAAASMPKLSSLEDLSGKEIYVRKSSSYYESLNRLNTSLKQAGKPIVAIKEISEYLETEDLLEMVNAGLIPMTIVDNYLADLWSQVFENIVRYPDIAVNQGGAIAWMIRKNSPEFKKVLDEFIKGHKKGTLFGNIMIKRYFKNTKWVRNSLADEDLKRFRAAVGFFKKYGSAYDVDWLLVAACAYQESGIDQSKRSPAGAIGVMQILPSTAAAEPINIPDIEKIESNIHAGVKYLRWIHDTYFKDEKMDRLDQARFTFASYNAGPARIRQLRQEALKMGLNPNVWFNHVEIVAAKRIGRETVQYVRNIHKYYTAYHLLVKKGVLRKEAAANMKVNQ
jgi:membrane-bound lytic murein transglycosylase MltF